MKRTTSLFKALCLAVAALFTASVIAPALAAQITALPELDQSKLCAFWQQEAYDGMINGEAVYDRDVPEGLYFYSDPHYTGGYSTVLVNERYVGSGVNGYDFRFVYSIQWSCENGDEAAYGVMDFFPDLYGPLDLAGTGLAELGTREFLFDGPSLLPGQTHITSVLLDDCFALRKANFFGQEYCTEFSALNCPLLTKVDLTDGAFTRIAIGTEAFEKTVYANAFGSGSVGMEFDSGNGGGIRLEAYPESDTFIGWFDGGELVSRQTVCTVEDGGNYRAVFGGDADGDGVLTVTDAVLALRMAMNLIPGEDPVDVNGSGTVDVSDAIMILRFAMGII